LDPISFPDHLRHLSGLFHDPRPDVTLSAISHNVEGTVSEINEQLRSFIEYKARETGIPVVVVKPHNTSRECPGCHFIDKRSRPERSHFKCVSCGFEGEADFVASLNIRNRAAVSQPIVTEAIFDHSIPPVASSFALAKSS
jgi:predicted RNA-binding Zn-ribbon protein involved in translation (DUF1610 family)